MLRWQQRESPDGWAEIHGRLADFYEKHVEDAGIASTDVLTDSAMQRFLVEEQYHRLCQSPRREIKAALDGFLTAFSLDERFAADLSEAILQAGEDCNEEEVTHWGHMLTRGIKAYNDKQYETTAEVLTVLLESNLLDDQSYVIAYAWRGLVRLELGQHKQAWEDMNASLEASDSLTTDDHATNEQPGAFPLSGAGELPASIIGFIVFVLLLALLSFSLGKNKNLTLPLSGVTNQNEPQTETSNEEAGSPEELAFDEETIAFLREHLKRLMKRKPIDQD
jgi:hypothetical protein